MATPFATWTTTASLQMREEGRSDDVAGRQVESSIRRQLSFLSICKYGIYKNIRRDIILDIKRLALPISKVYHYSGPLYLRRSVSWPKLAE